MPIQLFGMSLLDALAGDLAETRCPGTTDETASASTIPIAQRLQIRMSLEERLPHLDQPRAQGYTPAAFT